MTSKLEFFVAIAQDSYSLFRNLFTSGYYCTLQGIDLFFQHCDRPSPLLNLKVRSPLFSESAIALQ
ncbi:hypothetical protein QUB75_25510 [Microcoleus sp. K1-B6]|uniref:hypothetical protein n=1 Tax=Microcoleus TaxID=44471 RepID=UPI00168455C2|nr:hypothetical protein [Microcoleus sp. FACHB-DQ6]